MSKTAKPVRVLVLGTGGMARTHVEEYAKIEGVEIVAAVDTREDVLAAFCERYAIPESFASLEAAIEWGEFDAASNVTPRPT